MNKQDFISLIEHPELLGKANIPALKTITSDFPYFQVGQLLLAKALYNEKHYEFEKQLKYTALMVPDRNVLFKYIHGIAAPELVETVVSQHEEAIELEIVNEEIALPTIVETPVELPVPESTISEELPIESLVPELVSDFATEIIAPPGLVDKEIITPTIELTETHSFSEWLQLQQKQKLDLTNITVKPPAETPVIEETEAIEPAKATIQEQIAQQVERSNVNEFESILDKFIRENPRMSRPKAEFYNPINMAKQSVESDDELVTETLANVYYKQGHYKKAIRAYEKLCLIYPHKLTYFASLIQKIKTENKE